MAEATVYDEDGNERASEFIEDVSLVEPDGYAVAELPFRFDSRDWSKQEYTAEVLVRDDLTGQTSQREVSEVEVVEPLKHAEAEVVRSNVPETVEVGKEFNPEIEFRNTTNRDSSLVSTISRRRDLGDWKEVGYISLNIAASSERWWHQTEWQIEEPGNYQYRVDAIDDGWATVAE